MPQVNNNYNNQNYYYKKPDPLASEAGLAVASVATGLIYKALPSFSNPFLKQMKIEHGNNHIYKDIFKKSIDLSGLKEKGLKLVHVSNPINDYGKGLNACFRPNTKEIILNLEKASISGFHELGHAINNMKGGFGKILQKLRGPGMAIAGLMGTIALFSRNKPEEAKKNVMDIIQDNCGKIAFVAMLPTVAEESLASIRGIKIAKKAGLGEAAVKNLRKFYGKALLSYAGYAALAGFATYVTSKIMDKFTRPKKVYY